MQCVNGSMSRGAGGAVDEDNRRLNLFWHSFNAASVAQSADHKSLRRKMPISKGSSAFHVNAPPRFIDNRLFSRLCREGKQKDLFFISKIKARNFAKYYCSTHANVPQADERSSASSIFLLYRCDPISQRKILIYWYDLL
jgi:hypothetical protein